MTSAAQENEGQDRANNLPELKKTAQNQAVVFAASSNAKKEIKKENKDLKAMIVGKEEKTEMSRREEEQMVELINETTKESTTQELDEYKSKIFDELKEIRLEN